MCDYQSGHEKTITALLPALAGANVIYGLGMLEMGITFDLAQLVIDNEAAGMIKYAVNGVPVNDETLSLDVIKDVGIFQDFLSHEDTFNHMRSQSQAELIDRTVREDWERSGSTDVYQRAKEKMLYILETYEPVPLPDTVLETIRSIIEDAEEELGVSQK
ncbi:MAG: trimethylamine methyltransferase family protein [Desulfobacterales bacterium]